MSEQNYFKNAFSDFTYEAASGGAIRHLADLGYSVRQIGEQLLFPTPYERIRQTVWDHDVEKRVLLLEEPGKETHYEKVEYKKEYGKYGKTSFRRVTERVVDTEKILWKERRYLRERDGAIRDFLAGKCLENEGAEAYMSCDFGVCRKKEPETFAKRMELLNEKQRDYVTGLFYESRLVYHRLDSNMREILVRLYEMKEYQGACYFLKTEEKVIFAIKSCF